MMLRRMGHAPAANRIRASVQKTIREKKATTPDLGGRAPTMDYARAIVANLE